MRGIATDDVRVVYVCVSVGYTSEPCCKTVWTGLNVVWDGLVLVAVTEVACNKNRQ